MFTAIPTNEYGNVDLTHGTVPDGYAHIAGQRLTITCRRLGITHAPALTGWRKALGMYHPVLDGVVVRAADAHLLREAIDERSEPKPKTPTPKTSPIARARAAWRARAKRLCIEHVRPTDFTIEHQHHSEIIVLWRGDEIIAEYEVTPRLCLHDTPGPVARARRDAQLAAAEGEQIAALPDMPLDALIERALTALSSLNRRAKHVRGTVEADEIYRRKDRFLDALVLSGVRPVRVETWTVRRQSREVWCPDCNREWIGDTWCYCCADDTGIASIEPVRWYLIDCGDGHRYHRPHVRPEIAAMAVEVPPHDPTQPCREIPDVGMTVRVQHATVEAAAERLTKTREGSS